ASGIRVGMLGKDTPPSTFALNSAMPAPGSTPSRKPAASEGGTKAFDATTDVSPRRVRSSDSTLAIGDPASRQAAARVSVKAADDAARGGTHAYTANAKPSASPVGATHVTTFNFKFYAAVASIAVLVVSAVVAVTMMRSSTSSLPNTSSEAQPPIAAGMNPGMTLIKGGAFTMGTDDA